MKKIISLVMFLAAITMPVKAQIDYGVKGGLNLTSMSFSKDVFDSSNKMGFFVGPTAKFTLPVVGLGIDASLLFDHRSFNVEFERREGHTTVASESIKQQSIQIPVNARFAFGVGDVASILVFAGPQFGFNLSGKKSFGQIADWKFNSSNLSFNIGAGAMFLKHFQATLNYNIALGKTGEFDVHSTAEDIKDVFNGRYDGKMHAWQLSVAYFF